MRKAIHAEDLKKTVYFLLPVILTIILLLSNVTVARATETGSPPAVSAGEEMKNEGTVAMPAEESIKEDAQEGVQQEMPGMDQGGTAEKEKPEPAAEK